jgi:hypothetical protein
MDAMTHAKGSTPAYIAGGNKRKSSGDVNATHFTARVIGVEVVCGDISGKYIYYTDNLVGGGTNVMIEVLRLAIRDLEKLLADKGFRLPSTLMFQFDNCRENKASDLFAKLRST